MRKHGVKVLDGWQDYDHEVHERVFGEGVQLQGEEVLRRKCKIYEMETEETVL
jgi:hypothetical protein